MSGSITTPKEIAALLRRVSAALDRSTLPDGTIDYDEANGLVQDCDACADALDVERGYTKENAFCTEESRVGFQSVIDVLNARIADYQARHVPSIINYNDETGEWQYAVAPVEDQSFWLNAFPTTGEAVAFCKKHELPASVINTTQAEAP